MSTRLWYDIEPFKTICREWLSFFENKLSYQGSGKEYMDGHIENSTAHVDGPVGRGREEPEEQEKEGQPFVVIVQLLFERVNLCGEILVCHVLPC